MSRASASKIAVPLLTIALCTLLAVPAFADSQARIVRLSDVQGSVEINKNSGLGFESAFLNLPITQGTELRTRDTGRAEIEFEDGSTLRIGPNTDLEFSTLRLTDSGSRISEVRLEQGIAYVDWLGKSGDELSLDFSREKFTLEESAHVRADTSNDVAHLAVFKGAVDVQGPDGNSVAVERNKTATFDAADNDKPTIAGHIAENPLDSWDKESIAYHDQYAKNNSSPYGYGASDLGYYGNYTNVPGYGMMWQPFFTGSGWDPFMDGAWSWYPGMGYMFVSAYPWGWMPYMYGNWMYLPPYGWMWQPGGWGGWNTAPRFTGGTGVHPHPLVAPTGSVATVAIGKGGRVSPTLTSSRFVLNSGSAGLGIARGSLDNLRHLNSEVAKRGFAEVRSVPQFTASSGRSVGFGPAFSGPSTGTSAGRPPAPVGHSAPVGGGVRR
jgi:FecR protein